MQCLDSEVDRLLRETPRITAARIAQVLRQTIDPTFYVSERSVREYVAARRARIVPREAIVRLVYEPGEQVQIDFKEVVARIGGVETKLHMFAARLSYSTACFVRCYRSEDRPALFNGLVSSCEYFGGVPHVRAFSTTPRRRSSASYAEEIAMSTATTRRFAEVWPCRRSGKGQRERRR